MNEKQLAKLIRKTTAKAEQKTTKARPARAFDPTAPDRDADDTAVERSKMFDEMKRREF